MNVGKRGSESDTLRLLMLTFDRVTMMLYSKFDQTDQVQVRQLADADLWAGERLNGTVSEC